MTKDCPANWMMGRQAESLSGQWPVATAATAGTVRRGQRRGRSLAGGF